MWQLVWKMPTPPVIKIFWWNVC
jgi:hypothetical protein